MKAKIENNGSALVTIKGRVSFTIPAHGNIDVTLPDGPRSVALLNRLRREYPAMRITVAKEAAPGADQKANNAQDDMAFDRAEFAAKATAVKGESGWWTVTVEGLGPIKVRKAEDAAKAIELAWAEYQAATAPAGSQP